jgi:mannose-6-phosphate isomerase-like protein (cupin superfamily)
MPDHDLDKLMRDHYRDEHEDRAPERLADRIHAIPDTEPDPAPALRGWLRRLGWWPSDGRSAAGDDRRHRTTIAAAAMAVAALAIIVGGFAVTDWFSDETPPDQAADEAVLAEDRPPDEGFLEARSVTMTACSTGQGILPEQTAWREVDAGEDTRTRGGVSVWSLSSEGSIYGEDDARLAGTMTQVRNRGLTHDGNGRELVVHQNAIRVVNDGGSWEGVSTSFSGNRAVEGMAPEVVTLTGAGGYAGLTAILQLPASDDRAECFDIYGVVVEDGMVPLPQPYRGDPADIPVLDSPVEIALLDDGYGDGTEFLVLEPGEQTIVALNVGDRDHGFVIEDGEGRVLVGAPDEVIAPGERREYVVDLPPSAGGYVLYDPMDREGTQTTIASAE